MGIPNGAAKAASIGPVGGPVHGTTDWIIVAVIVCFFLLMRLIRGRRR
jgi:hypothetical protein